ncbi:CAI-1 autoinducer synthase [Luteibacter jiangsuensis]|uniref:CAI-1 autoinducer synthase n=1 Tax=Luteibacter jiangsuensis TaxID=637577 RepID=A0ABT9SYX2_9GAMM|nr:alpha-hydroxyketone-type quorum-sensing autoinducer synthase [Luteibacter jiangsuensis]MDQ0010184.1 CAI-1 autoinducer synthase [Luteibacter jiangsuensis]
MEDRSRVAIGGLPDFMEQRLAKFRNFVMTEWGGRHVFRSRPFTPGALVLCTNDYLSISNSRRIVDAQCASLREHGAGLMMSSLFNQDPNDALRRVEQTLADAIGTAEGVLTQSGYCANIGLMQAIACPGRPVYIDVIAHASLHAGIRFAGATAVLFHHNDIGDLRAKISQNGAGVVVIDSIYSTNGSLAPIRDIVDFARAHDCLMVVDESHSLGTHGLHGRGLVADLGLAGKVDFVTVSLAKAYCSRAGFIACPKGFRDYFGFESLPAIFSSSLLPHDIAGIRAAHEVVVSEEWRRDRLHKLTRHIRCELASMDYPVDTDGEQIIALEVGSDLRTAEVRDIFEDHGIFGSLFTPPATSRGRSLVRLSLHAGLSDCDLDRLLTTLRDLRVAVRLSSWSGVARTRH